MRSSPVCAGAFSPQMTRRNAGRLATLLAPESTWADLRLGVELAVETVQTPAPAMRVLLRDAFERCSPHAAQDHLAVIRTGVVRLLGREPERTDLELFRAATETYLIADGVDVAAEMRALGLAAIAVLDSDAARWIAAALLFDSAFIPNQEPCRTAVDLLCRAGDHTLLLDWLDRYPGPHPPEAAALAEEELAQSMPVELWVRRAQGRLTDERAVETLAAVTGALKRNDPRMYPELRSLLLRVMDGDLFRALAFTFASARETAVQAMLLAVAEDVREAHLVTYIEAAEMCRNAKKDAALTVARRRSRQAQGSGEQLSS